MSLEVDEWVTKLEEHPEQLTLDEMEGFLDEIGDEWYWRLLVQETIRRLRERQERVEG